MFRPVRQVAALWATSAVSVFAALKIRLEPMAFVSLRRMCRRVNHLDRLKLADIVITEMLQNLTSNISERTETVQYWTGETFQTHTQIYTNSK